MMRITAKAAAIKIKRILVATDLSDASLWSLPYVTEIANRYSSMVFLAHAIPLETYAVARPQSFDRIEAECLKGAQRTLDSLSAGLQGHGVQTRTLLTEGDTGVILPQWIKKHRIDMVAVGTVGRSGVRKLLLGSVAEEIIRTAECPVLTVGQASALSAGMTVTIRNIIHATDFSADSLEAGAYAVSLAQHHRSRLVVLHVRSEHESKLPKATLAEQLQRSIPGGLNLNAETLIAEGNAATKILEIANEHSASLIVIGVRGAGEWPRRASHFGSTAHDIVLGAPCPVFTVRK
jgi:nucleotide-binding universal stress UspA family protein